MSRCVGLVDSTSDTADAVLADGLCADADGFCTLRAAVQEANATAGADDITLPAETYTLTIAGAAEDAAATGDLDVLEELTITGAGAGVAIIDANGLDRAIHVDASTTLNLIGVTIANGAAGTESGGAIHNSGVLTIAGSDISGNSASDGGGISSSGTATIVSSTISGNTAPNDGGGIFNSGTLAILTSTISGNGADWGGGIRNTNGTVTIENSTIVANTATSRAGGIYGATPAADATLAGSILAENIAPIGPDCASIVQSNGYTLIGDRVGCTIVFAGTGDLIVEAPAAIDPQLGPLADNGGPTLTHFPLIGSPVIDDGA